MLSAPLVLEGTKGEDLGMSVSWRSSCSAQAVRLPPSSKEEVVRCSGEVNEPSMPYGRNQHLGLFTQRYAAVLR